MGLAWRKLVRAVLDPKPDPELDEAVREQTLAQAPVIWLLGKVQAGKTSIIRAMTGAASAEIGNGFRPCTRHSMSFDFPVEAPLVRFIDTRGLGEVGNDPTAELALLEDTSHAIVAVARAMDPGQEAVLDVLRAVRQRDPDRPVLLVQTRLHDGYPDGADHPGTEELATGTAFEDLRRAMRAQEQRFAALPGNGLFRSVAVDLTPVEEGYSNPEHGLADLLDALDEVSASGQGHLLRNLARHGSDSRLARARPHLLGYATSAGVCDLVPVASLVTVPAVQAKLLHSLAGLYGQHWDRKTLIAFLASLGSGAALGIGAGFAARQFGKLIPVYGQTAGAAAAGLASAAVTYALGRAACEYLELARRGRSDPEAVAATWRGALKEAHAMFRKDPPSAS
ncbi:MAG: DUF697 domain-containing protein [Gammaproteobacteria bacterium]|nr:DUF697 domain-containing protein [Gammaproteobacteria bacterium]